MPLMKGDAPANLTKPEAEPKADSWMVESIDRLDVKAGDTVVIRLSEQATTSDVVERIQSEVARVLPDGVKAIVLAHGLDLTVE